jgi:hypothetical protein
MRENENIYNLSVQSFIKGDTRTSIGGHTATPTVAFLAPTPPQTETSLASLVHNFIN